MYSERPIWQVKTLSVAQGMADSPNIYILYIHIKNYLFTNTNIHFFGKWNASKFKINVLV